MMHATASGSPVQKRSQPSGTGRARLLQPTWHGLAATQQLGGLPESARWCLRAVNRERRQHPPWAHGPRYDTFRCHGRSPRDPGLGAAALEPSVSTASEPHGRGLILPAWLHAVGHADGSFIAMMKSMEGTPVSEFPRLIAICYLSPWPMVHGCLKARLLPKGTPGHRDCHMS